MNEINKDIPNIIDNKKQYGWYVYINKTKADFGGVHTSLEQSKKDAINFINRLKKLNTNSKTP
jgi:hypothetical protein